jgi:hypothetical protein
MIRRQRKNLFLTPAMDDPPFPRFLGVGSRKYLGVEHYMTCARLLWRTSEGYDRRSEATESVIGSVVARRDGEMVAKRAPVRLTGGAGFRYEDLVGARFVLDMLGGKNSLGAEFGRIRRVDLQARDTGWFADDVVVTCAQVPKGERTLGLSLKIHRQVTRAGFPPDFVEICWQQWFSEQTASRFREGDGAVGLVTGQIAAGVKAA